MRFTNQFFNYIKSKSIYPSFYIYQPNKNFIKNIQNLSKSIKKLFNQNLKNFQTKFFNTYKIYGYRVPSDYFDHLYFVEFINGIIQDQKLKFLEVGGGSSLLSSFMHNLGYTKSVHLDLAPYLLAQKLFLDNKGEFYLSERILDINDVKVDFLINQDSFPEISYKELKKIFDFIEKNKINKFFK